MPLFALPLPNASKSRSSARVRFTTNSPARKRKRASSLSSIPSDDEYVPEDDGRLSATSINPLSLTPDEVAQYRLAGLDLGEQVPSIDGWPHRGFADEKEWFTPNAESWGEDRKGKGKASDTEDEDEEKVSSGPKRQAAGPRLRMQHLSVLTAILQRCLLEEDIPRASRAWAMLIRAQVAGAGVDIRETGYWGIGAELLIRNSQTKAGNRFHTRKDDSDYEADDEDNSWERVTSREQGPQRWGTQEGLDKAKAYFERLILQYPYTRQYHGSISALDFWPAMVACEIYGVQYQETSSLRKIARAERGDEDDGESDSDSDVVDDTSSHISGDDGDGDFSSEQRRKRIRSQRKAEKRWTQKEEVRQTALAASEAIAGRMDELMTTPPFSDSHNLLRLRGMLALYIGNLSVPAMLLEEDDENDVERRFLVRQRISDHERGKRTLEAEQARARKLFEKIAKDGGNVSDLNGLYLGHGRDEMDVSYDD